MGSDQSKEASNKQYDELLKQYQKEGEIKSGHFASQIQVFKRQDNKKLFVNRIQCTSSNDFKDSIAFLKKRPSHDNLINLLGVKFVQQKEMCGDSNSLLIAYEYFNDNLADELVQRQLTGSYFSESHIWLLFQQLVDPCCLLDENNFQHGDIKPMNIFLNEEGSVKTIVTKYIFYQQDCNMFPNQKTGILRVLLLKQTSYLSPMQLTAIKKKDLKYLSPKSDVYSLGMTILECLTLQSSSSYYNFDTFTILHELLSQRLNLLHSLGYSQLLSNLVKELLQEDEENRPSFEELKQLINRFRAQINNMDPFYLCFQEISTSLVQNSAFTQIQPQLSTQFPPQFQTMNPLGNQSLFPQSLAPRTQPFQAPPQSLPFSQPQLFNKPSGQSFQMQQNFNPTPAFSQYQSPLKAPTLGSQTFSSQLPQFPQSDMDQRVENALMLSKDIQEHHSNKKK